MPAFRRDLTAVVIASIMVLAMCTPLGEFLEANLAAHMVAQHFVFILAGFVYAYGIALMLLVGSRLSRKVLHMRDALESANSIFNNGGIPTFTISALLIAYWYIPTNFDAAVLVESVHVEMHLTLLVVGVLIFIGSTQVARRVRRIVPVIAGKAMGLYGMFLLLTPVNVYSIYSVSQQANAGVVLLIIMLVMDFTLVPAWLYEYFGTNDSGSAFSK